jgi:hypothetical protein
VLSKAQAISGDAPSTELMLALCMEAMAEKNKQDIQALMDSVFIKAMSLQELEDEGKLPGVPKVIDLSSVRNIRDANVALDESIELLEQNAQLKADFDLERKHAAALNPDITLGDEWDSKDIYLENFYGPGKIRQIVGLHATGMAGQYSYEMHNLDKSIETVSTDFEAIEVWGNEYDSINEKEPVMIGRGSFRIGHSDIDKEAKQWEADGWKRIPNPWKKKNEGKT